LHSYQVLTVVLMEQRRQLERWQSLQAARAARPRARAARRPALFRGLDLRSASRRLLRLRRRTLDAAVCC